MVKDTNFKFGTHAPTDSPHMTTEKNHQNGAWSGSRDPVIFWELSANSSKTVKSCGFQDRVSFNKAPLGNRI